MRKLLRLELSDVGRFGRASFDFSAGRVVGLCGPNGSGKSTVMNALHFAVTGDNTRLGGREAVSVSRSNPDRQPTVRLVFETPDGDSASLTRLLPDGKKPGTRKLIHGDRSFTAEADIEGLIGRWCGVNPKILSDVIFVAQGKLSDVITDQPAKRAEVLHRLFGLEAAEAAREAVADHLASLPGREDAAVLAALRSRLVEAAAEVASLEEKLAGVADPDYAGYVKDKAVVATANRHAGLLAVRERQRKRLVDIRLSTPPPLPAPTTDVKTLEKAAAWWVTHNSVTGDYVTAKAKLSKVWEEQEKLTPLPVPPKPVRPKELEELAGRKTFLDILVDTKAGSPCPVCSHPLPGEAPYYAAKDVKKLAALEAEAAAQEAAYTKAVKAATAREQAIALLAADEERRLDALLVLERKLADLEETRPTQSAEDVRTALAAAKEAQTAYTKNQTDIAACKRAAGEVEREIAEMDLELSTMRPETEVYDAADRIKQYEAVAADLRADRVRLDSARTAYARIDELVTKAEASERAAARLEDWRMTLNEVRTALHRDSAPAQAVKSCLVDLSADLNDKLVDLGAKFQVEVSPDGKLDAVVKVGGKPVKLSSRRLSGGQVAALALAWHLAVADRYAPGVGFLCLDEPTYGLDAERLSALRSAIEAWKNSGNSRQIVIVTHDKRLAGAFDTVIDLQT